MSACMELYPTPVRVSLLHPALSHLYAPLGRWCSLYCILFSLLSRELLQRTNAVVKLNKLIGFQMQTTTVLSARSDWVISSDI